jgi:hypothetical protein
MKKLTEALKQMLDGLAYAHAGEYLTPREKELVLSQGSVAERQVQKASAPESERADARSKARRVALYMGSELPAEVMDYVIETCVRLHHELTVLTFESESTAYAVLAPHQEDLKKAGINMKLVKLSGQTIPGLSRYLRGHPEVAFLACKDSGYLGRSYLTGTQRKNAIPVPVVVVTTGVEAGKQLQPVADLNLSNRAAS